MATSAVYPLSADMRQVHAKRMQSRQKRVARGVELRWNRVVGRGQGRFEWRGEGARL